MAVYLYKARKLSGEPVEGSVPADSERAALSTREKMGLFPLDLRPDPKDAVVGAESDGPPPTFLEQLLHRRVSAESAARFARELADLSGAGVPILRALDAISERGEGKRVVWGANEKKED